MNKYTVFLVLIVAAAMACGALALAADIASSAPRPPAVVEESARQIPVAANVDVVVIGGQTGAVSAAVEAAKAGAKVFLLAPHNYLGDDMTATLQLWLEPGETADTPLARQIYSGDTGQSRGDPYRLDCNYTTDKQSIKPHQDTDPPTMLTSGHWGDAVRESLQFDGDVRIVADIGDRREIGGIRVVTYVQKGGRSARAGRVTVFTSDDHRRWRQAAVLEGGKPGGAADLQTFFAPLKAEAHYVRFDVTKAADAKRLLLAQVEVLGKESSATAQKFPDRPRPLHVKKVLDDALLHAGVEYLYGCFASDVLHDGQGNVCGIVMTNRAGRQAVTAKVVIDASDRALVARMAGASFQPYTAGTHTFHRVVIGGDVKKAPGLTARVINPPFRGPYPNRARTHSSRFPVIDYTLRLPMDGDTPSAWAAADQQARTLTYDPEQQFTSDVLWEVPPDAMRARQAASGAWQGADGVPLAALQPADVPRLYVLGGCADVSRDQAARLLRPPVMIRLGARVGQAAAAEARSLPAPAGVRLSAGNEARENSVQVSGDVREFLAGARPEQKTPTIRQAARRLPVLGQYDVVVIGGGTSGAPAGIAAARHGARTLVVEYLSGLGGVGTTGQISKYFAGNRVGFVASVPGGVSWVMEQKQEWYRSELLKAGAEIWFGCIGCGALVDGDRVTGTIVTTPQGRGVVLAKTVIDGTGNSDIAAAAGVPCVYTDDTEFAMQGTGLPYRNLGDTYINTDFTFVDETDIFDVWHVLVYAKQKYPQAFDQGQLVDTRERRRIVGQYTLTVLDEVLARTFPDTICVAESIFDTHGYTIDPYLMLQHPEKNRFRYDVPYRCLLPKKLGGILVVGLGLSAHRDALPLLRQQGDEMNIGYAAGVAAAMAARESISPQQIDVRTLQKDLILVGNLPPSVLTARDSLPMSEEKIAAAVAEVKNNFEGSAVICAHPQQSLPLLRMAYAKAAPGDKLNYAEVLAILGDGMGVKTLLAAVAKAKEWDEGWRYRGGGQFGEALSPLDKLIIELGRTRDRRAVPVIIEKAKLLTAESEFSHYRAVALALELIGDPAAAPVLAEILARPGIRGFAQPTMAVAMAREVPGGTVNVKTRSDSLRELLLARALYRCGDRDGLGEKILREYAQDLRGHLARHAEAVLAKK